MIDQTDIQVLPQTAQDLVALIGLEATIKLVEAFGGTAQVIPKSKGKLFADIVEIIGESAAYTFCANYSGNDLYIPKCDKYLRRIRNQKICAEYDAGSQPSQLAIKYRLSDRQVFNIFKKPC